MNFRTLLLVSLLCMAAIPALTLADSNYMGGDIVLGGSGPTIRITEVTTAVVAGNGNSSCPGPAGNRVRLGCNLTQRRIDRY